MSVSLVGMSSFRFSFFGVLFRNWAPLSMLQTQELLRSDNKELINYYKHDIILMDSYYSCAIQHGEINSF